MPVTRKWGRKPPPPCTLGGVSDKSGRALLAPGSLLPSFLWVHWPQIHLMLDDAMAMLAFSWQLLYIKNHSWSVPHLLFFLHASTTHYVHVGKCVGNDVTDTTPTAEKLADISECCRRVGTTFPTCRRQTKMSVI